MAKIPITEVPIRIWTPLDPQDPCIAKIGNLPMSFYGATPMKAKRAAEEWRQRGVQKERDAEANKEKRRAALKKHHEEKKEAKI